MISDAHTHLDTPDFSRDLDEVIARARETGVGLMVNVSFDMDSSQASIRLAERYPEVFAAVGFHPHEASKFRKEHIEQLARLATGARVVAIGEIGLDFHKNYSPREAQLDAFRLQLDLAAELNLPVVIHCREAHKEILSLLKPWAEANPHRDNQPRGVIHCFSGDEEQARQYLSLGFLLSLAGPITYHSSTTAASLISRLSLDTLLVETDCPFLSPEGHRGRRNEPAYVWYIARRIAEIKNLSSESVAEATTNNTRLVFRLPTKGKEKIAG